MYVGEPLATASIAMGKPKAVIFREMPGYQWRQSSGLVITVITGLDGGIALIDESATPPDQPLGLAGEDARESGFTFNQSGHANLNLDAPSTSCKGNFGADCWEYHYDNDLIMRMDFAANSGSTDGILREVTLAKQSLLQQLHFDP
jgi:hypothetical protein